MTTITIDEQGRLVLPRRVRDRLGLPRGQSAHLRLWDSPEGVIIEPEPRSSRVEVQDDGMPALEIDDLDAISNEEVLGAIHRDRATR